MSPKGTGLKLLILVPGLLWSGCGRHKATDPTVGTAAPPVQTQPEDPERKLYEQVRTGTYQLTGALENLQTAEEMAKKLSKVAGGTAARGFADLSKKLDAAGEDLADYTSDAPSFEDFKANIAAEDDQRLNAIDDSNDALGYIADAQDIVENLLAGAPDDVKPQVQQIQDQLDDCVDSVESAITEMGGKLDEDPPQPGSQPANGGG